MSDDGNNNTAMATSLTLAWLSNPNVRANEEDAARFLKTMRDTIASLDTSDTPTSINDSSSEDVAASQPTDHVPAVTVRKSLASKDHIISMIDGKPYTTLKRHLSKHGLTPAQYRERYGLKADYPMTAPAYSEKRRALAKSIGLGAKGRKRTTRAAKA